jgi:tetratricopeptide (TPR) repeat protein
MDAQQQPGVTDTPVLQPPGQSPDSTANDPGSQRWLWAAMAILLTLGLVVVFALPRLVAPVPENTVPAEPLPAAGDSEVLRDTAHQSLQAYLQLRARMDLDNAAAWGEPEWSAVAALVDRGDRDFARRQFAAAARGYQAALQRLQQLAANREVMLSKALEEAARALAENDAATANARFEVALAIAPEHPAAIRGLARAHSRDAVIGQMNLGQAAEASSDLEAAVLAYGQAAQLDAEYEPAQVALQRVTAQINARDYTAAMTQALAALDAGRTAAAGTALAEAERLRPGDPAVRDARQRLQGMRAQAGLDSLRRQAAASTAGEDWSAAAALYRKALEVDPAAGFAREGLVRAEERIKLHAQFDHYLESPVRVYSAAPLANATQLLAAASAAPAGEPRLARKITALQELVAQASTPVAVTLNSDGVTSVVVYRVAKLGQFDSRQLELLPGDYTVVGSRPGYRDVRKVLAVRPGVSLPPLLVRCEEAI